MNTLYAMYAMYAMTDANMTLLLQSIQLFIQGLFGTLGTGFALWLSYKFKQSHDLQIENRDALNGHLAKLEKQQAIASLSRSDLSYTQGQEAGPGVPQASRSTPIDRPGPFDARLGPDPMHVPEPPNAGNTTRPA
jgi:hypothetical protein